MAKKETTNGGNNGTITVAATNGEWKPPRLISIEVKKAKITSEFTLHAEYIERYDDGNHSTASMDYGWVVHNDLKKAFEALVPHLVIICDLKDDHVAFKVMDGVMAMDTLSKYACTGFSIGGSDDREGVILTGKKAVLLGSFNFNSPFVKFESNYDYASQLHESITTCISEVLLYLKGKSALKQQSLEFEKPAEQEVSSEVK